MMEIIDFMCVNPTCDESGTIRPIRWRHTSNYRIVEYYDSLNCPMCGRRMKDAMSIPEYREAIEAQTPKYDPDFPVWTTAYYVDGVRHVKRQYMQHINGKLITLKEEEVA